MFSARLCLALRFVGFFLGFTSAFCSRLFPALAGLFFAGFPLCFFLLFLAQLLLSLKRIENWPVWVAINAISVFVYGSQQLWLYTALYAFFFVNAFWGWWEWRRGMRGQVGARKRAGGQV